MLSPGEGSNGEARPRRCAAGWEVLVLTIAEDCAAEIIWCKRAQVRRKHAIMAKTVRVLNGFQHIKRIGTFRYHPQTARPRRRRVTLCRPPARISRATRRRDTRTPWTHCFACTRPTPSVP